MTYFTLPVSKMDTPCVLFTSCSDFPVENIVKDILKVDVLPDGQSLVENVVGYRWNIETKYYTAHANLCITKGRTIGDQSFANCVEAFVVYFDPNKENTFSTVKTWLPFLDQLEPDIKMLVCDRCTDNTEVTRLLAQTWCIDHGFELVELNAEVDTDSDVEDDFVETTGIKRIVQSLQAHTWPNLVLKDERETVSPYIRQLMKEQHEENKLSNRNESQSDNKTDIPDNHNSDTQNTGTDNASQTTTRLNNHSKSDTTVGEVTAHSVHRAISDTLTCNNCDTASCDTSSCDTVAKGDNSAKTSKDKKKKKKKQPSKEERLDSLLPPDDVALFDAMGTEDPGEESFEKLFEKFATMKEKANALPRNERKKYAESVAVAFWNAMGGDDDEIGNLDDSD